VSYRPPPSDRWLPAILGGSALTLAMLAAGVWATLGGQALLWLFVGPWALVGLLLIVWGWQRRPRGEGH
jgi:hypothetical protein